ncbi:unnamed protein product [Macrosiphum euphorbiae]|uniref:LAGLIDADG homing endonuclease n=1 Tax=Macrosiphum euphorbiae TaxID=13131 RepID=A0AAV0VEQ9_9HEMI|nr:unnamed protein product [Macrosiphum euphorbiae]
MAEESYLHRTVDNIGDWILVKYIVGSKGKKIKHFVGIIKDKTDTNLLLSKFVKLKKELKNSSIFVYPVIEDIDKNVLVDNISCRLPLPKEGKGGELIFMVTFSQFNLK